MFRPRIIPVLLLKGNGLVKTIRFREPTYIGDPINAVRIFNDLGADELVFLDITATAERRVISRELIKDIGDEAYMPFSVGGGIASIEDIRQLLSAGAEKVVLNSAIQSHPVLIEKAAGEFGRQSIIASVDTKKGLFGSYSVYVKAGKVKTSVSLREYIKEIENAGAGEILINSIDKDGTLQGYDLDLISEVSGSVSIPVIACGGAGSLGDMKKAFQGGASACAAGSMFVYHGSRRGVLINYPEKNEIINTFKDAI